MIITAGKNLVLVSLGTLLMYSKLCAADQFHLSQRSPGCYHAKLVILEEAFKRCLDPDASVNSVIRTSDWTEKVTSYRTRGRGYDNGSIEEYCVVEADFECSKP